MDMRLVLGQHPSLIIIKSLIGLNIVLGASQHLKELSLVKLHRLVQLVQWTRIMIIIWKSQKHLSVGLVGTLTLKDQQLAIMLLGIDMVLILVPNS